MSVRLRSTHPCPAWVRVSCLRVYHRGMTISEQVPAGWLSTAAAAERAGCAARTVYGWIRAGQVDAATDAAGRWFVEPGSLDTRAAWPRRRGPQVRPNRCPACGHDLRRDLANNG